MSNKIPIDDIFSRQIIDDSRELLKTSSNCHKKILELGSGSGNRFSIYKENLNWIFFCLDIDLSEIKKAKRKNNCKYVCADINSLPFKDSSFDLIISYSVFQYINWREVIIKSSNLLRSKGEILFIETLEGNPFAKLYRLFHNLFNIRYKKYLKPKEYLTIKGLNLFDGLFEIQYFFYHVLTPLVLVRAAFQKAAGKDLFLNSEFFYNVINHTDKFLISHMPSLKHFTWFILIHGEKGN